MEEFHLPFKERVVIGVLLGLGILGILFILFFHNKPPQPEKQTKIAGGTAATLQPSPILSPVTVPPSWNTEDDTRYAIAYPPAWHTEPEPAEGRDVYMTFSPDILASNEAFPLFIVQVYPRNKISVQQRISDLSYLDLQQSPIEFQGRPAILLSGILPITFETGNPLNKPVFKTYIIFQRANRVYMIDFTYFQDENAEKTKQLFAQMVATLALPQ